MFAAMRVELQQSENEENSAANSVSGDVVWHRLLKRLGNA